MSDSYRTVTATFRHLTDKAFFVDRPHGEGHVSIPRSLVHAADDGRMDGLFAGESITFRLRTWKAEELGLA